MWKYFVAAVSMVSSFGAFSATQDEINSKLDKQLSWISTDNTFQFNNDISLIEFVKLAIKLQPKKFNREFFFKRYTKEYCKDVNKNEFDLNKCLANDVHADTVIDEYLSKIASEKQENRPTKVGIFSKVDYSNYVFERAESKLIISQLQKTLNFLTTLMMLPLYRQHGQTFSMGSQKLRLQPMSFLIYTTLVIVVLSGYFIDGQDFRNIIITLTHQNRL